MKHLLLFLLLIINVSAFSQFSVDDGCFTIDSNCNATVNGNINFPKDDVQLNIGNNVNSYVSEFGVQTRLSGDQYLGFMINGSIICYMNSTSFYPLTSIPSLGSVANNWSTGYINQLISTGYAARSWGMTRATSGAGKSLTINSGGAASGSTDQGSAGLVLQAAAATTGDGGANIYIETIASGQGTGTTDRMPDTVAVFSGTGMDLYGTFTLDSLMNISIGSDTTYNKALGNIKLNDADSTLYMYDGKKWQALFTR